MKKFWGPNVQYGNYSQQYFIIYLNVINRVDLKCYHYKSGNYVR